MKLEKQKYRRRGRRRRKEGGIRRGEKAHERTNTLNSIESLLFASGFPFRRLSTPRIRRISESKIHICFPKGRKKCIEKQKCSGGVSFRPP